MSGQSKLRLIGVGWSGLVGILLSVLVPALQTWVFFSVMLAFAAGWLILLHWAARTAPDARLFAETGATLLRCSQAFGGQFDSTRSELFRVQQLLTEAIENLLASFHALSNRSAGLLDQNVGQAVVSLQFQDVVAQLIDHVTKRLDELHGIMREIEGAAILVEKNATTGFAPEQAERLRAHLDLALSRLDRLHDKTESSPVRQQCFNSGEVVLF